MTPYFVLTGAIVLAGILFPVRTPNRLAWGAAFVALVLFTGLRHKVGMDWNNYLHMSELVASRSWWQALDVAEPAYATLLWMSSRLGLGVYGVNLIGAIIFCFGLFKCARATSLPWLALAVAMPMLVVVVSMSANRQAVAIGLLLWLVGTWRDSGLIKRLAIALAAATFHFSAIFFLAFIAWDLKLGRRARIALGIFLAAGMVGYFYFSGAGSYYDELYVTGQSELTHSPGALQHVMFNGVPALAVLLPKRLREVMLPFPLLTQMAFVALLLIPLSLVLSTASGRMTLYLFPVSMFVFTGLSKLIRRPAGRAVARTITGYLMLGVLAVWLNFANSNKAHIPYRNALLVEPSELHL